MLTEELAARSKKRGKKRDTASGWGRVSGAIGGPDELACDYERCHLRGDAVLGFNLLLPLGSGLETVCLLAGVASAVVFFGLADGA